jgi:preprotein translocase subunit YajC
MKINCFIIAAVIIGVVLLVYLLIKQNKKDRKKIEKELNHLQESEDVEINDEKES